MFPALQGGLLTTGPPRKSLLGRYFKILMYVSLVSVGKSFRPIQQSSSLSSLLLLLSSAIPSPKYYHNNLFSSIIKQDSKLAILN